MATRRIDSLIVELIFRGDTKGLENVNRKLRDMDRQVQAVVRGAKVAVTAAIGIGTAAFFTGSKAEREFAKFQTQLGDTEEQVEALKPQLRALSKETGQSFDRLAAAAFNLKSSVQGISDERAFEVITAAAKAATIELGNVDALALVAGVAIRQFGEDTISGQKALDILHATIRSGTIPDAGALASNFGQLLGPGKELNLTFEELAAAVAGYSQTGQPIPTIVNAIRQAITQLNAPSTEAQKVLDRVFPEATNSARALREMIGRDGLFQTLQFLRREIGDDAQALRRLVGDVNALGFVLDATGDKASAYTDALEANRNALGSVNAGLDIYKTTGAHQAQIATNNLRLALDSLYNTAVVPLLKAFGKLPSLIQTVALGLTTLSAASLVLGGPSLGALIGSLGRFIVALKTGTLWNSNFILSLRLAAISAGKYVARLNIAAVATKVFKGVMLITTGAARIMWAAITGPIGIAIAAFAALGFVVYKFRRQIVDALKTALSWAKQNWPLLVGILLGPFGIVGALVWKFRDQILGAFQSVWDWLKESPIFGPVIDGIQAIIDFVRELPGRVLGILKNIPGMVADAIKDIPGLGTAINVITGAVGKVRDARPYAQGGMVPGPLGRPLLATVHGGEMVLPADLTRMIQGFAAGPDAILPVAPPGAATIYRQLVNNRPTVSFSGDININITTSPGADSTEIAENVKDAVRDVVDEAIGNKFRDIAHDFDGPIAR